MTEFTDPPIVVFYVNGSQLDPSDTVHVSPWSTLEEAFAACKGWIDELNLWAKTTGYPNDPGIYVDPAPIEDTIHPGVRYGVLPLPNDNHPAPPTGAVFEDFVGGLYWQNP